MVLIVRSGHSVSKSRADPSKHAGQAHCGDAAARYPPPLANPQSAERSAGRESCERRGSDRLRAPNARQCLPCRAAPRRGPLTIGGGRFRCLVIANRHRRFQRTASSSSWRSSPRKRSAPRSIRSTSSFAWKRARVRRCSTASGRRSGRASRSSSWPGANHNIINTGSVPLKLYTLYAPPNHRDGVVHHTRDDAEADSEHFDGKTTE